MLHVCVRRTLDAAAKSANRCSLRDLSYLVRCPQGEPADPDVRRPVVLAPAGVQQGPQLLLQLRRQPAQGALKAAAHHPTRCPPPAVSSPRLEAATCLSLLSSGTSVSPDAALSASLAVIASNSSYLTNILPIWSLQTGALEIPWHNTRLRALHRRRRQRSRCFRVGQHISSFFACALAQCGEDMDHASVSIRVLACCKMEHAFPVSF